VTGCHIGAAGIIRTDRPGKRDPEAAPASRRTRRHARRRPSHCYQRGLLPALIWRSLSGMAVAGTYMPGLRALIDGMAVASRARAADWFTSFFLLGSSLSFLLRQAGLMRTGALVNGALGVIACCLPGWCYLTFSPRTASRNTELSPGLGPRQLGPAVASPAASPQPTRQTARGDQEPKSSVLSGH
jgi:hypothetical protein